MQSRFLLLHLDRENSETNVLYTNSFIIFRYIQLKFRIYESFDERNNRVDKVNDKHVQSCLLLYIVCEK
jgi:hypothetical protein